MCTVGQLAIQTPCERQQTIAALTTAQREELHRLAILASEQYLVMLAKHTAKHPGSKWVRYALEQAKLRIHIALELISADSHVEAAS